MNIHIKRLIYSLQFGLCFAWPSAVYAAELTLSEKFTALPRGTFFIVFLLSTLSGLTSFVNNVKKKFVEKTETANLKLIFATNLMGSNLMGLVTYLYTDANQYSVNNQAIAIILGAFGGVWLLEKIIDRALDRVLPETDKEREDKHDEDKH